MKIFNYQKIDKEKYLGNKPFSHIEIDNCWNEDLLKECGKDIYQFDKWDRYALYLSSLLSKSSMCVMSYLLANLSSVLLITMLKNTQHNPQISIKI